ncbi:hypothetical protein PsorP6_003275 [Peronosclerospora sorghi]|uniref:Uncharacterized protein n=1 Tax=Peronosclerospora sorghi TaxID=230839 RepID=A0ACC0VL83_9STRA|nr:hypothetical protein PsorP6_003275 [Peronosclerospora sorghi]
MDACAATRRLLLPPVSYHKRANIYSGGIGINFGLLTIPHLNVKLLTINLDTLQAMFFICLDVPIYALENFFMFIAETVPTYEFE